MARNYGFENIPAEDQRVEDDFIDELIQKYLCSEDMNSLYEDTSVPLPTTPEPDKWPGEAIFPADFNYSQDFLVPDLFLLENMDGFSDQYDDGEPQDELMAFLEEIIAQDEKKAEGNFELPTTESHVDNIVKPENISNSTDPETPNQEATEHNDKRKRPKTSTDAEKKAKKPRRQPIIMKRAKRRNVEE